jgi:transposase InsO family protein
MKEIDPVALFRLAVLGPVISRPSLAHGEQKELLKELSAKDYDIPGSHRRHIAAKTLHEWLLTYRREGVEGLEPKERSDQGSTKIPAEVQERLLAAKRENPRRSIRVLRDMIEREGLVRRGQLSRSAIHRFLRQHGLSRPIGSASVPEERRSFLAEHANDIWYGDVMHGPRVLAGRQRKSYLVTLMDDASRLVAHSAFCLSETAVQIEGVLKQAVLKRGVPRKLVVDNGAAYRSASMQQICARLGIALVYCRPYHPEGKGKLERWHRTFRDQFVSELGNRPLPLGDLNANLWAWIEEVYHRREHSGLGGLTPLARYLKDLERVRLLGTLAYKLDDIFQHRIARLVRKDGTVSFRGRFFEVPYELCGKKACVIVDPHTGNVVGVEDGQGRPLSATPLDRLANRHRRRHKPNGPGAEPAAAFPPGPRGPTLLDHASKLHYGEVDDDRTDL